MEVGLASFDYAVYPPAKGKSGYEGYLTRNTVTVAELLQDAGYNTYTTGKWHLGGTRNIGEGPIDWGFDQSYGIYVGGSNHWNQEVMLPDVKDPAVAAIVEKGGIPPIQQEMFYENGVSVQRPVGVYSNDLYTAKMIEFMEKDKGSDKPFFAYLAYTTAHLPIQAPKETADKYYEFYLETGYENLKKKRFEMLKKHGVIPENTKFPDTDNPIVTKWDDLTVAQKQIQARIMATYSAMIDNQDEHIGKVLEYLKENNKLDNTLVIYMTDNGPEGTDLRGSTSNPLLKEWVNKNYSSSLEDVGESNSNWQIGTSWANTATGTLQWWKGFVNEGGIRVPLIVMPPANTNVKRGISTNKFASVKEVPMTILDYAGVKYPENNRYKDRKIVSPSGISIKSFLENKTDVIRTDDEIVCFELFGNKYVVSGEYKACILRTGMWGDGKWHLYNLQSDPGETTPLEVELQDKLQEMITSYDAYAMRLNILPVEDSWNPYSAISH
jgi:arylsulfatase A-like enzyme